MTRRDFIAVAEDFHCELAHATPEQRSALYAVALSLCATFHAINARFDRARFLAACGF